MGALSQKFAELLDSLAGTMSTTIHPSTILFATHYYTYYHSMALGTKNPGHTRG